MSSIAFSANTLVLDLKQNVGSLSFTGSTYANGSNHAGVTTPPFSFIVVTDKSGSPVNYLIQPDAIQPMTYKTYTINGPDGAGVIKIIDPDSKLTASFKQ